MTKEQCLQMVNDIYDMGINVSQVQVDFEYDSFGEPPTDITWAKHYLRTGNYKVLQEYKKLIFRHKDFTESK